MTKTLVMIGDGDGTFPLMLGGRKAKFYNYYSKVRDRYDDIYGIKDYKEWNKRFETKHADEIKQVYGR